MDLKSLISDLEDIKREIEEGSSSDAVESLENVINEITILKNLVIAKDRKEVIPNYIRKQACNRLEKSNKKLEKYCNKKG